MENQEEFEEYTIFTVTAEDGSLVEMALVDEFEFENKMYVVGAKVEGDSINEDGVYIYRAKETEDDFTVEKITNQIDYEKIVDAYMKL